MANGTAAGMSSLGWLSAASTLLQVWGNLEQGRMARIQGERARYAAEFAAWQAERAGGIAIAISQRQALEEERQATLVASRALAVAAASGAGVSDPTIVRIIANARGEGAYRANVALYEGEARARELKFEAITGRIGGWEAQAEGAQRQQAYGLAGLGALARGGASLYAKYGMKGPGTTPTGGSGDAALIDAGTPGFTPVA